MGIHSQRKFLSFKITSSNCIYSVAAFHLMSGSLTPKTFYPWIWACLTSCHPRYCLHLYMSPIIFRKPEIRQAFTLHRSSVSLGEFLKQTLRGERQYNTDCTCGLQQSQGSEDATDDWHWLERWKEEVCRSTRGPQAPDHPSQCQQTISTLCWTKEFEI